LRRTELTSPTSALRSSNSWSAPRVSRLGQSQPRQTASLCCIGGDQSRQFRTLLRDFRRPCPCCTHRLHPPIKPPLGPTHQFRCSKKLLARHHFHDPPPRRPNPANRITPTNLGLIMARATLVTQSGPLGRLTNVIIGSPRGKAPAFETRRRR
jgi:hypothetical protein